MLYVICLIRTKTRAQKWKFAILCAQLFLGWDWCYIMFCDLSHSVTWFRNEFKPDLCCHHKECRTGPTKLLKWMTVDLGRGPYRMPIYRVQNFELHHKRLLVICFTCPLYFDRCYLTWCHHSIWIRSQILKDIQVTEYTPTPLVA